MLTFLPRTNIFERAVKHSWMDRSNPPAWQTDKTQKM